MGGFFSVADSDPLRARASARSAAATTAVSSVGFVVAVVGLCATCFRPLLSVLVSLSDTSPVCSNSVLIRPTVLRLLSVS